MYKGVEYSSAGSEIVVASARFSKIIMSHLLIGIRGVAVKATEAPKLIVNAHVSGGNALVKNLITNVPMNIFGEYKEIIGGRSWNSTTDLYLSIPVGTLNLKNMDFNVEVKGSSALAANALTMNIYAARYSDDDPVVEYQYRQIPVDAVSLKNVLQIWDTNTAYNSSVVTKLHFEENNSELSIPHKMAFVQAQQMGDVATETAWGLIHPDKDMGLGRSVRIEPSAAFYAFTVHNCAPLN